MSARWKWAGSVILVCSMLLAACSGNNAGKGSNTGTSPESSSNGGTSSASSAPSAGNEGGSVDWFGKYDTPITLTSVMNVNIAGRENQEELARNNLWTELFAKELGINVAYDWVTLTDDNFKLKLNATLASGDLPDVIPVDLNQLNQLTKAGQIQDLTAIWDQYATEDTKNSMYNTQYEEGTLPFDVATIDGKLMGIPLVAGATDLAQFVWIRQDWLDKLGLQPPKSMEDLHNIATAFKTQDPDGNGKDDTYGLTFNKDLFGSIYALEGFFNGYKAYPNIWVEDGSGSLAYGSIQPEMKTALAALQNMYKNNEIDREFGVKDAAKAGELAIQDKAGIVFGEQWTPFVGLMDNFDKGKDVVKWTAYPLPSVDGTVAKSQISVNTPYFLAVRKDYEHPEAIVKMFNVFNKMLFTDLGDQYEFDYLQKLLDDWVLSPARFEPLRVNLEKWRIVRSALDNGDQSGLNKNLTFKDLYVKLDKYRNGDNDKVWWALDRIYGTDGAYAVMNQYENEKTFYINGFLGAATPTMVKRTATLSAMQQETFTKIIVGAASVDEFDTFVANWKKLGGDEITKEVNDWKKEFGK